MRAFKTNDDRSLSSSQNSNFKCCGCNGQNAVCKYCKCARSGKPCTNCQPGKKFLCSNTYMKSTAIQSQPLANHDTVNNSCVEGGLVNGSSVPWGKSLGTRVCPEPIINGINLVQNIPAESPANNILPNVNNINIFANDSIAGRPPNTNLINQAPTSSHNSNIKAMFLTIINMQGVTVSHLPKSSRICFANKYESLIKDVLQNPSSEIAWLDMLFFPLVVLKKVKKTDHEKSLSNYIKENVRQYAGFGKMHTSQRPPTKQYTGKNGRQNKKGKNELGIKISDKINEGNIKGAIQALTSQDTIAEPSNQVITALQCKHPDPTFEPVKLPHNNVHLTTSSKNVKNSIFSFPSGSSHGHDGLKPQHLKEVLQALGDQEGLDKGTTSSFLSTLTCLINIILKGTMPQRIKQLFFGARLIPFNKKDGGLRPIAVGLTLRRICSKLCVDQIKEKAILNLSPTQVGFGVSGGAESLVHSVRHFLQTMKPNECLVKLDFSNAFNSLERNAFLTEIHSNYPDIFNYVSASYEHPSTLLLNDSIVWSKTGVQQGDPLGPALFALSLQNITKDLDANLNVWYLDDGSIGGECQQIVSTLKHFLPKCNDIGLSININKSEIIASDTDTINFFLNEFPGIKPTPVNRAEMLGVPIGGESALECKLNDFIKNIQDLQLKLSSISNHQAMFLLQKSLGVPKLIYILRTSSMWKIDLSQFDNILRHIIAVVLNIHISDEIWSQMTLPIDKGGIGIRKTEDLATSCFLASVSSNKDLIKAILSRSHPSIDPTSTDIFKSAFEHWQKKYVI